LRWGKGRENDLPKGAPGFDGKKEGNSALPGGITWLPEPDRGECILEKKKRIFL